MVSGDKRTICGEHNTYRCPLVFVCCCNFLLLSEEIRFLAFDVLTASGLGSLCTLNAVLYNF